MEPEAAAVYWKWIQIERDSDTLNVMKPGRRFLVLDPGGMAIMYQVIILYQVIKYQVIINISNLKKSKGSGF